MKTSAIRCCCIVFLGAVAVASAACSDPQKSRDKYFAQGNTAFEAQKYPEAILAYRNAVKYDAMHAPSRQKLAEAYEKTGDLANAARQFVRAADLLPKDAPAQLRAARYLLAAGQFEDAATRARRALEVDARSVDAHILLGSAIAGTKDLDGAVKQMQEAIDIDPLAMAGHVNMGALLLAQNKKAEAQASFEKAVKLKPDSIEARLALATYHLNVGAVKEAEATIKEALTIAPADGQANRAMGLVLIGTGRAAEAEPFVKAATKADGTAESEMMLADYYLRTNKTESAKPILERLAGSDKLFAPAGIRLAAMDYASNRKEEAHKRLDGLIEREPARADVRVLKGQWLLLEGRTSDALAMAQAAVKADAKSAAAHFLLGRAKGASSDKQGAEEAYAEVLRLNPQAAAAQTELARLNLVGGKADVAAEFARDAIKNQPTNANARVLLVRSLIARQDHVRAATELAPLTAALPDDPTIRALNATVLAMKKDFIGARREYERVLQADPGQIDALSGMTGLDIQDRQLERARQRLSAQLERTPQRAPLLILAAQADLLAKDWTSAEKRLRQVIGLDPSNLMAYGMLAQTYLQQRRLDEALKEYEQLAQKQPRAVGPHTVIGMIHNQQNRLDEAEKAYRRALEADPSAPVAANNLAYLYADRNHNLEEALSLARGAAERLKDNAAVIDTVGWVYYKKGQPELAVPQFQASIQKEPGNPFYHYHLGLAYAKAGEDAKARRALDEALRLNPAFEGADDARRVLASLAG